MRILSGIEGEVPEQVYIIPNNWTEENLQNKIYMNLVYWEDSSGLTMKQAKNLARGLAQTIFNEYNYQKHLAKREMEKK